MNMVLSYQYCCMSALFPVASSLKSSSWTNKKSSLCFGRKMHEWSISTGSSSSSSHPLMMIPSDVKDELDGRSLCRFYDYLNEKVVNTNIKIPKEVDDAICVGSSHGWLAYISCLDFSIFLWNPFTTSSPLISLPPIHTLPSISLIPREEVDEENPDDVLSRYQGDTLRYQWKSAYDQSDDHDFGFKVKWDYPADPDDQSLSFYTRSPNRLLLNLIRKIVLSSVPTSDDCIVVALPGLSIHRSIAFCKPGDKSWTFVEPPRTKYYHIADVIHFKDQLFYTITSCGRTLYAYDLAHDLSSPKSYLVETCFNFELLSSLEQCMRSWCDGKRYYLVESLGDLLWVRRHITNCKMNGDGEFIFNNCFQDFLDQTTTFDVYRLDFSRNTWECIKCIGDQVLFLGTNQSLSLSARDFPSLKANCIHFTDDSCDIHKKYPHLGRQGYTGHDYGHYELAGGYVFGEFCRFGDARILPPPFWVMRHFH